MAFSNHKGTVGHTIGTDIIGKDNGKGPAAISSHNPKNLSEIKITPGENGGFGVTHRMKPGPKQESYDPRLEQSHMFGDAESAHIHLGSLMGIKKASGERMD